MEAAKVLIVIYCVKPHMLDVSQFLYFCLFSSETAIASWRWKEAFIHYSILQWEAQNVVHLCCAVGKHYCISSAVTK